jgi:hypothetical protein
MSEQYNIKLFTFFKGGILNTSAGEEATLETAAEYIRQGTEWPLIQQIRKEEDKKKRNVLKKKLSYFCFSGTFTKRDNESLIEHSNLICLDFDDVEDMDNTRLVLKADPYTHMLFTSTSGSGFKMLVRINGARHRDSFLALEAYFLKYYNLALDKSGKDVSRACYVSADTKLIHNPESEIFLSLDYDVDTESGEVTEKKWTPNQPQPQSKDPLYHLEKVVERLIDAKIDLTESYNDWQLLAFSMATFGESGRSYFHQLSSMNLEYTAKDADSKFDNAVKTGRFTTPSWFFRQAKNRGVDITIKDPDGVPMRAKTRAITRRMESEIHEEEEKELAGYEFIHPKKGESMTEDQRKQVFRYAHFEFKNKTYYAKFDNDRVTFEMVANFGIKPLYLIMSKTDAKRLLEITNETGSKQIVDIPAKAFTSVTEFEVWVTSVGNFWQNFTKAQFQKIKRRLYAQTQEAEEVRTLGYHRDGFYAFANGIISDRFVKIDEYGIVTHEKDGKKKSYFLPALSLIYRHESELYETEKRLVYVQRDVSFSEWSELFIKVHKKNGWIALNYYVAALFRDFIYSQQKFFPHLFLFGPPGTGKSNTAWSLMYLFGLERKPFNLNAGTQVGFHRTFAQIINGLVWFDEYANTIEWKRIQDMKGAYDGSGHVKGEYNAGSSSNKTVTTPINSACIISGQELPTADNALFKRTILCQYFQTEYSQEEASANERLKRLQEKGLSEITGDIVKLRGKVEDTYAGWLAKVRGELKEALKDIPNIEGRIVENAAQILAIYPTLGASIQWPFTYEELRAEWITSIRQQNTMIVSAKETSTFWDMVSYMVASRQLIESEDFIISAEASIRIRNGNERETVTFQTPKEVVFLRLTRVHPLYLEALRKQGQKAGMDLGTLKHYLQHSKEFIGNVDQMRFKTSNTSAFAFDYDALREQGHSIQLINEESSSTPIGQIADPSIEKLGQKVKEIQGKISLDRDGQADDDLPF